MKRIIVIGGVVAALGMVFGLRAGSNVHQAEHDREVAKLTDQVAANVGANPADMNAVGKLIDKASTAPATVTAADVAAMAKFATNSNVEIRHWAFGALCSLRQTPYRERAIE